MSAQRVLLFRLLCYILENDLAAASGRNSVVECLLPKQDVVGSNPIARSSFSLFLFGGFASSH